MEDWGLDMEASPLQTETMKSVPVPMILGIIGGVLLVVGSLLTWATVSVDVARIAAAFGIDPAVITPGAIRSASRTLSGISAGDGTITLVAGIVVIIGAVLVVAIRTKGAAGLVMVVAGVVGAAMALYDAFVRRDRAVERIVGRIDRAGLPGDTRDLLSVSLGAGIWICAIGGIVTIVAGVLTLMQREPVLVPAESPAPPVAEPGGSTPA